MSHADVSRSDLNELSYQQATAKDYWNIEFVKEIQEMKYGDLEIPMFGKPMIEDILHHLCSS